MPRKLIQQASLWGGVIDSDFYRLHLRSLWRNPEGNGNLKIKKVLSCIYQLKFSSQNLLLILNNWHIYFISFILNIISSESPYLIVQSKVAIKR